MSWPFLEVCWPLQMPPTQKAVLISLADNADDSGECFPSIPTICKRTCFSERAVHGAIKWLEEHQLLTADRSNGRHTRYCLTPNGYAPPQEMHPRSSCATAGDAVIPPQEMRSPPQEMRSNHQEPSLTVKSNRQSLRENKHPSKRFGEFWQAYPKKVGKQKAEQIWISKNLDPVADQLIADVTARTERDSQWENHQFIPYPERYLRNERWNDQWTPSTRRPSATDKFNDKTYQGSTDEELPDWMRSAA